MASSLPNTVHRVNSLCIEQALPIGRNTCSALKSNILPIPTWQLLKDNIFILDLGRGHDDATLCTCRWGLCELSIIRHLRNSSLSQKTEHTCALTSGGQNSPWSFLRGSSQVIILNLAWIKFSTSFVDGLINFSLIKMRMTRPYSRHMK